MPIDIKLCSACFTVLLAGCAIMGRQQRENPIDRAKVNQVQRGMTKSEVTDILGAPVEIIFSNKEHDPLREHAYIFEHVTTKYTGITFGLLSFGNVDEKKDRVVVFFDERGDVESVGKTLLSHESSYGFPFGK
ncbi:MAG: outer membrane protein assembly factor BamE [Planctomycetota bacterium]|nr:outer membrane protein assembly factor BamE [Planctomycetota bacterium]